MPISLHVAFAIAAFTASSALLFPLRRWLKVRALDIPGDRSSHAAPTPRGGGLAIVITFMIGATLFVIFIPDIANRTLMLTMLGALIVAVVSWFDDVHSLHWQARLLIHGSAAAILIMAAGPISAISIPSVLHVAVPKPIAILVSLLWVIGLTNAYNFMDGIDGIAAGQAIVAGIAWAILGWNTNQGDVAVAGVLLAGASAGFLLYNWPPASLFMGDVGSAFLGYAFAALTLVAANRNPMLLWCGVLLVWPFLFDTIFTFFRRVGNREYVFSAHRSHLYQRLVITGMSHGRVSMLYAGAAFVGAAAAIALQQARWVTAASLIATIVATAAAIYGLVIRREGLHRHASAQWPPASRVSDRTAE